MSSPQILVHSPLDNVGVIVVEYIKVNTDLIAVITENNSNFTIPANMNIPIGHKIALKDLKNGDTIIKYGEDIGKLIQDVKKGDHVHVHNLKTKKW